MKARRLNKEAPGGPRTPLKDVLPLNTPFVMQFFPIYACNFRCKYCHMSIAAERRPFLTAKKALDFDLYKKTIDDMSAFPSKIKTLRFVGMGEPLLHKNIAEMVAYAKKSLVADTVEIVTNGSLLTGPMSEALIMAGLDRMVVSLQGAGGRAYGDIAGIDFDFDAFVDNLSYFYQMKEHTHVYFKVVDCSLDGPEDEERFFEIFGDICDTINIEHTVPLFPGVDFNRQLQSPQMVSQFGLEVSYTDICPQPFYFMQINPDGQAVGCQSTPFPEFLGSALEKSVVELWNGRLYNSFRRRMLDGRRNICQLCRECNIMNLRLFPEDDLTDAASRLKALYQERT